MTVRTREFSLLDLPDPAPTARFVYGRYVADEARVEPPTLTRDAPRWVELTARAPTNVQYARWSGGLDDALVEADFSSGDFSVVSVDTADFPSAYVAAVSGALHTVESGVVRTEESRARAARDFAALTSGSAKRVGDALARLELLGDPRHDSLVAAGEASLSVRVNSRLVGDFVSSIASNVLAPQAAAASASAQAAASAQQAAVAAGWKQLPPIIDVGELEIGFQPTPAAVHVGFAVWKRRASASERTLVAVLRTASLSWRDPAVAYGASYEYEVRALYGLTLPVVTRDGLPGSLAIVVQSGGARCEVTCVEAAAPPPPTDVRLRLSGDGEVSLSWSPPVDPTRDVVQYQIFKRASLDQPFTLLAVHDFSDAQLANAERIPPELVVRSRATIYVDSRATVGDIYAVCCVDARGLSSRYSSQLRLIKRGGKQVADRVCPAGCPKALPNLLAPCDPFPDVVYDSGKSTLVISLAPQAYSVADTAGTKRDVLSAAETYVAQVISLDALKSRTVTVSIRDERSR